TEKAEGLDDVVLAVGAGEDDDADAGRHPTPAPSRSVTVVSSITGLARKRWHRSSTADRAVASSGASMVNLIALPTRTSRTPSKPRAGSERSMVAPCGSATPARNVTSTSTENCIALLFHAHAF